MAVRKRAVRAEKKTRRLLWLSLASVLVLAAVGVWYLHRQENTVVDLPRSEDTSVVYFSRDTADIASITVENETGVYTLRQQEGVCTLDGYDDFIFSDSILDAVLHNAALIATEETLLTVSESNWTDYGLGEGCIRVSVAYHDGQSIVFRIGDLLPQETPLYYFRVEGDNRLGAVSQDVQETYMLSMAALHQVTDPALNGDLIDKIAFAGENAFTMEMHSDGWYLTAPFRYPLNDAAVETVLSNLEKLRFAQYVGRENSVDLSAYGLQPPRRTLTLSIAPSIVTSYDENGAEIASQQLNAYELVFDCGDDIGDILFYCLYRGDVVKATKFSSGLLLTQSYENLLLTSPFNVPTNALTRLEWEQNGVVSTWDLTLHERVLENNEFETDESGNILYDVRVWQNGAEVDSSEFLLAYSRLIDVKTLTPLPASFTLAADAQPEAVIRLIREDGQREVAFYPFDALHWAVSVDGVARYYVSRDALNNVGLI